MKVVRITLAIAAFAILFACGKNNEPFKVKEVADSFLLAMLEGDLAAAKNLCTSQTTERWSDFAQPD